MAKMRTTLGENVKRLRKLKGWSQQELGAASGVKQRTISNIERGTHAVGLDMIELLASALRVGAHHLLTPDLDPATVKEYQHLVESYTRASPEGRRVISMVAEREAEYGSRDGT